jgi:hypothetical protein
LAIDTPGLGRENSDNVPKGHYGATPVQAPRLWHRVSPKIASSMPRRKSAEGGADTLEQRVVQQWLFD